MKASSAAAQITCASRSNLAAAFLFLPADRRRDMETLYAFCRVVDDLSDDDARPSSERRDDLTRWRKAVVAAMPGEDPLAEPLREMAARRDVPRELLQAIIDGVTSDLDTVRFPSFPELERYCWRVASAVGLASIEVFGYRDPACRDYAEALGIALQLTNILRDVGPDATGRNRIYIPADEMARCGVSERDLASGRTTDAIRALMRLQAGRAKTYFARAEALLPRRDRRAMIAAEMMRGVYRRLLARMERDGFRVMEKRYRLGKLGKFGAMLGACLKCLPSAP
jgi:phytoene synthase